MTVRVDDRNRLEGSRAAAEPRALVARLQRARARARRRRLGARARAREVLLDLLLESGRVLHGARRRPHGAGRRRHRGPLGRRPAAVRDADRDPRARPRADVSPVSDLDPRPRSSPGRERDRRSSGRGLHAEGARRAGASLQPGDLPRADSPRRRPRATLPVHLRPLEQPGRSGSRSRQRRGALRAREDSRGPAAVPRGRKARRLRRARERHRPLPPVALPADGGRRARRLPRHAGCRLRGVRRGGRPSGGSRARASAPSLRRRRAAGGVQLRLEPVARTPDPRPGRCRGPGLPDPRPARPGGPLPARRARPARSCATSPGCRARPRGLPRSRAGATSSPRSGAETCSSITRTTRS